MQDKISILVCAYNTQATLWKCVRSVMLQKYRPLEVIILDDGSTDKTGKVADFLAERYEEVKVFHQSNQGIATARNKALALATGEWIFFLDSDDMLADKALTTLIEHQKRFNADMVIGSHKQHFSYFSWRTGVKRATMLNHYELSKAILKDKEIKSYVWGKLIHRSLFDGLQFNEGKAFEDIGLIEELVLKAKRVRVIPEIVYHYTVQRKGSITANLKVSVMPDYLEAIRRQIKTILQTCPQLNKECMQAYRRSCLLVIGSCIFHQKTDSLVFDEACNGLIGFNL